jgi:hypothetical protein
MVKFKDAVIRCGDPRTKVRGMPTLGKHAVSHQSLKRAAWPHLMVKIGIVYAAATVIAATAPFYLKAQAPLAENGKKTAYTLYTEGEMAKIQQKNDSTFYALLGSSPAALKETKVFEPESKVARMEGGDGKKRKIIEPEQGNNPALEPMQNVKLAQAEIKLSYLPADIASAKNIIEESTSEKLNAMDKDGLVVLLSSIDALKGKISPNLEAELMRTRGNAEEMLSGLEAMEKALEPAKEGNLVVDGLKQAVKEYVEQLPEEKKAGREENLDSTLVQIENAKGKASQDGGVSQLAGEIDRLYEKANAAQDSASAMACASEMLAFYEANKDALRADQQLWNGFLGKLVNGMNVALEKFGCELVDARMFIVKE